MAKNGITKHSQRTKEELAELILERFDQDPRVFLNSACKHSGKNTLMEIHDATPSQVQLEHTTHLRMALSQYMKSDASTAADLEKGLKILGETFKPKPQPSTCYGGTNL